MIDQDDNEEIVHLHEVNEQLTESLERCRNLLRECRDNLAANSNEEPGLPEAERRDQRG
jgi:hypothetical protein